jgi:hypothetical protein
MRQNKWLINFLFCFWISGYAQETAKPIPLASIISQTEQQFNVKFSYAVADVSGIRIAPPAATLTLAETINYLNSKVLLNFKILDDRYVTVSLLDKTFSICGIVTTANPNISLPGATVRIIGTTRVTITTRTGSFELQNVPLNIVLSISYIGYEERQFTANELFATNNNCIVIALKEKNEELNQVLITTYLTTGLQKYLDGSTVLNTKKFGILPGLIEPDVLQTIQVLPGVESTNESIANINVRGGTNDQNLMLWDNIKMYHSGHFFGLISAYNPNLTNKVIVTKNGTSAEYSDGVSSTINMSTKDEVGNAFSGGAGINLISADAYLEIPLAKNLELDISGRRSSTDLFTTPTFSNYFNRSFQDSEINTNNQGGNTKSDFYFYDYTAKLLFDLNEKHQFRANIIGINNSLDYAEFTTSTGNTETKMSSLAQKNSGYGGNWNAKWDNRFSTNLSGYLSKYSIDATDYRIENEQLLTETNEVLETEIKLNAHFKASEYIDFLAGYQFTETGMLNQTKVSNPRYSSNKKDVLRNHGLYTETEYHKDKTYLRLGVRMNYFQKFNKLLFEPRVNIRQQIAAKFALKFEGEFKNQTTAQIIDFEDDFLGVEKRRWVLVNNTTIPIASSKQASLGVEFKQKKIIVDLTAFYKSVNGITASNQGFYNNYQYVNASGSYIAKGVEFLANKTARNYSTWLSYTFSTNDYEFKDFSPPSFPNNVDIRHSASLGFTYDILSNFKISVGGIWRNGQPYTIPLEGNETVQSGNNTRVNYDNSNTKNLGNFVRLDASLSYNFNLNNSVKATLRAGVVNATNQNNIINRYYKVDPDNDNAAIKVDNQSLGMTPNVSFRVNF